jgi:hypothetical protein
MLALVRKSQISTITLSMVGVAATIATAFLLSSAPAQARCFWQLLPNGERVMNCVRN